METMANMKILSKNGLLYPMLIVAAISVIVFSAIGVASMTGLLPRAESRPEAPAAVAPPVESTGALEQRSEPRAGARPVRYEETAADARYASQPRPQVAGTYHTAAACTNCGVVQSIHRVEAKAQHGSGLGMIAGGVGGALIGNQIGRGNGNAVATIAGAAGGAFAGNEIEKHVKKSVHYQVKVRMDDGTYRTINQSSSPGFRTGDSVRIEHGRIVTSG